MTKPPSILIPNTRDPQQEAFAKSVKAVTDYLHSQQANTGTASAANVASLQAQVAALQRAVAALQAEIAALGGVTYRANADIVAGQVLYEVSYGIAGVADSATEATAWPILGVATTTVGAGQVVYFAGPGGSYGGFSGLTVGPQYLSMLGTITPTPPAFGTEYVVCVGYAITDTTLYVQPELVTTYATDNLALPRALTTVGDEVLSPWVAMPSLNTIGAGLTVAVPAVNNLLVATVTGLTIDGTLGPIDGTVVMV